MTQTFNWRGWFSRRKEKIEITVETSEYWEIRRLKKSRAQICPGCAAETIFVPPDLAAQIFQVDATTIENLISADGVHLTGNLPEKLICLSSLKKIMGKGSTQNFLKEIDKNL